MKAKLFQRVIYLLIAPLLAASLPAGSAGAWSNIYDNFDTCTEINCNVTVNNANIGITPDGSVVPFTLQVIGDVNSCLRLDLAGQEADMEMVVVAPNGAVYRNDNRSFGDLRPLIKIAPTPVGAFYTVHISPSNGILQASRFPSITLYYGQYNNGNPNCANPTPGL